MAALGGVILGDLGSSEVFLHLTPRAATLL